MRSKQFYENSCRCSAGVFAKLLFSDRGELTAKRKTQNPASRSAAEKGGVLWLEWRAGGIADEAGGVGVAAAQRRPRNDPERETAQPPRKKANRRAADIPKSAVTWAAIARQNTGSGAVFYLKKGEAKRSKKLTKK